MTDFFAVRFIWVPAECGGHRVPPWQGMRTTLRWQRWSAEWESEAWDCQCVELAFDAASNIGVGVFRLTASIELSAERLAVGTPVELLGGYRVLAVGCLVDVAEAMREARPLSEQA